MTLIRPPARGAAIQDVVGRYSLTTPCINCPFRTDVPPYLRRDRAREIVESLVRAEFPCHKTTVLAETEDGDDTLVNGHRSRHCAGALIMLEHADAPSQMMRIAERLGHYDPRRLDMDAPVFRSPQAFIAAQEPRDQDEHDPCHVSGSGCEWPAGMMMGGSAVECDPPPDPLTCCRECGEPTCDACMVGDRCGDCV